MNSIKTFDTRKHHPVAEGRAIVIAQQLESPQSCRHVDTETVVWTMIVILLGLSCLAYLILLEKVGG